MTTAPLPHQHQIALIMALRTDDRKIDDTIESPAQTSLIRRRLAYRDIGSVILTPRGILTAARCADPNPTSPLRLADEIGWEYEVLAVDQSGRLTIRDTYNRSTTLSQVRRGSVRDTGRRTPRSPFEED
jgi:hypothetical protein